MDKDKILIICGDSIPPDLGPLKDGSFGKNIKTISLNNSNLLTDINCYYLPGYFKINSTKVIEKNTANIEFINLASSSDYIISDDTITIKNYSTNIYFKLAYILWIQGYNSIGIYGLDETIDKSKFRMPIKDSSISIYTLLDIYSSEQFGSFAKSANISIINSSTIFSESIPRMEFNDFISDFYIPKYQTNLSVTIYKNLFSSNNHNVSFISKYYKYVIMDRQKIRPLDLLGIEYLIINKDLISIDLAKTYSNYLYKKNLDIDAIPNLFNYWVDKFLGLPINSRDYSTIKNYYKFNPKIYGYIIVSTNMSDEDLFIHWILNFKDKYIFNFPEGFNLNDYIDLNPDLKIFKSNEEILKHFLTTGINEERNIYKGLDRFDWKIYCLLNDLHFTNKYDAENHYITSGKKLGLITSEDFDDNFSVEDYVKCNPELKLLSRKDAIMHYVKYGKDKNNYARLPKNFNPQDYLSLNPDIREKIKSDSEKDIINHWIKYGVYENRQVSLNKISYKKRILCICHNGNMGVFKKIEKYLENLLLIQSSSVDLTLFISSLNTFSVTELDYVKRKFPSAIHLINENFGFDIGSFFKVLQICKENKLDFDYVIKIHTKTNDYDREKLVKPILGSENRIKIILDILSNESIGLVGSLGSMYYNYDKLSIHNQNHLKALIEKFKIDIKPYIPIQFIGGTMFWTKFSILKKIFWDFDFDNIISELNTETSLDWNWYLCANEKLIDNSILKLLNTKEKALEHYTTYGQKLGLSPNIFHAIKFKTKSLQIRDGMIEHAYERFFSYAIESYNYVQYFIQEDSFVNTLKIKPLPIVFPQFHQIPENDKFWGEGFTEWTLLDKIDCDYTGKKLLKPHKSLGNYNILDLTYTNFVEQMLKNYTIPGLCYYHYWFNGHKVLYKPIEKIRDESKPNIQYCLSWANETWSSRWDGLEHNVLLKQEYGSYNDWVAHIQYLLTFFKDPKYIKINNKPLFFIYRPCDIPDEIFDPMIECFNLYVKSSGFDGIELIISFNNISNLDKYNFYLNSKNISGVLDFNPNYINTKKFSSYQETDSTFIFELGSKGELKYDEKKYLAYNPDVKTALDKKQIPSAKLHYENISAEERKTRIYKSSLADIIKCYDWIEVEPRKHKVQLYSTFMDWNNSPRRDINKLGIKPTIFLNANPSLFKKHLKNMILKIIRDPNPDYNYILINAWNEWNEQTCLEPSDIHGYKYLEACKEVFNEYY